MATTYDITLVQGDTLDLRFKVTDSDDSPINLSGYSARGVARMGYGSDGILLNLNPKVVSGTDSDPTLGASGFIDVYIRPTDTSGVPVVQGVYDVEKHLTVPIASGDWEAEKVVKGYFNVVPEVTISLT
tara:strand:- start:192 stop:578 length:387 start_codon:yes stop_codon:yes gene_type:complete